MYINKQSSTYTNYIEIYIPKTLALGIPCRLEALAADSKLDFTGNSPSNNTITYVCKQGGYSANELYTHYCGWLYAPCSSIYFK